MQFARPQPRRSARLHEQDPKMKKIRGMPKQQYDEQMQCWDRVLQNGRDEAAAANQRTRAFHKINRMDFYVFKVTETTPVMDNVVEHKGKEMFPYSYVRVQDRVTNDRCSKPIFEFKGQLENDLRVLKTVFGRETPKSPAANIPAAYRQLGLHQQPAVDEESPQPRLQGRGRAVHAREWPRDARRLLVLVGTQPVDHAHFVSSHAPVSAEATLHFQGAGDGNQLFVDGDAVENGLQGRDERIREHAEARPQVDQGQPTFLVSVTLACVAGRSGATSPHALGSPSNKSEQSTSTTSGFHSRREAWSPTAVVEMYH